MRYCAPGALRRPVTPEPEGDLALRAAADVRRLCHLDVRVPTDVLLAVTCLVQLGLLNGAPDPAIAALGRGFVDEIAASLVDFPGLRELIERGRTW